VASKFQAFFTLWEAIKSLKGEDVLTRFGIFVQSILKKVVPKMVHLKSFMVT